MDCISGSLNNTNAIGFVPTLYSVLSPNAIITFTFFDLTDFQVKHEIQLLEVSTVEQRKISKTTYYAVLWIRAMFSRITMYIHLYVCACV